MLSISREKSRTMAAVNIIKNMIAVRLDEVYVLALVWYLDICLAQQGSPLDKTVTYSTLVCWSRRHDHRLYLTVSSDQLLASWLSLSASQSWVWAEHCLRVESAEYNVWWPALTECSLTQQSRARRQELICWFVILGGVSRAITQHYTQTLSLSLTRSVPIYPPCSV